MKTVCIFLLTCLLVMSVGCNLALGLGFQNAGFENGNLDYWDSNGIVSVISGDTYVDSAYNGDYMALISMPGDGGGYVENNYISQSIDASSGTISFWYNVFTADWEDDKPGFEVKINGNSEFTIDADCTCFTDKYSDDIWYTGWQQFTYDISSYTGSVEIAIYAGNTDDDNYNTWAYIDLFTPEDASGPPTPTPSPVPEPGTLLLMALGLAGLACWGEYSQRQE